MGEKNHHGLWYQGSGAKAPATTRRNRLLGRRHCGQRQRRYIETTPALVGR